MTDSNRLWSKLKLPSLRTIQLYSGGVFSSFLTLHLTSTACANWGPLVYNKSLNVFRYYYQNPLVEGILLSSLVVHSAAGIYTVSTRKQQTTKIPLTLYLHRISALYLVATIVGHISATRILGLVFGEPRTFSHVSFTLDTWPWLFYPYYTLLAISGLYHMSYGLLQIFKKIKLSRTWWWCLAIGGIGCLLISGVFVFGNHPLRNMAGSYSAIRQEFELLKQFFLPWHDN